MAVTNVWVSSTMLGDVAEAMAGDTGPELVAQVLADVGYHHTDDCDHDTCYTSAQVDAFVEDALHDAHPESLLYDARQSLDALHLAHDTRWPIRQCPLCAPLGALLEQSADA